MWCDRKIFDKFIGVVRMIVVCVLYYNGKNFKLEVCEKKKSNFF